MVVAAALLGCASFPSVIVICADAPAASTANRIVRLAKIAAKQSTARNGSARLRCRPPAKRRLLCISRVLRRTAIPALQWQAGKTLPVVAVVPEIRAAPVAQTLPAVTVDRSGQSGILTAMVGAGENAPLAVLNLASGGKFAAFDGSLQAVPAAKFCQLHTGNGKLCGL